MTSYRVIIERIEDGKVEQSSMCQDEELSDALSISLAGMGVYELEPLWTVLELMYKTLSFSYAKLWFEPLVWEGDPKGDNLKMIGELCMKMTLDGQQLKDAQQMFKEGTGT